MPALLPCDTKGTKGVTWRREAAAPQRCANLQEVPGGFLPAEGCWQVQTSPAARCQPGSAGEDNVPWLPRAGMSSRGHCRRERLSIRARMESAAPQPSAAKPKQDGAAGRGGQPQPVPTTLPARRRASAPSHGPEHHSVHERGHASPGDFSPAHTGGRRPSEPEARDSGDGHAGESCPPGPRRSTALLSGC